MKRNWCLKDSLYMLSGVSKTCGKLISMAPKNIEFREKVQNYRSDFTGTDTKVNFY